MRVKVVILNWNGREHLARFLSSVVANSPEGDIVVADNGSTDDSLEFLRANFPTVELVELDHNYGYAEGYNRALDIIEADAFVLLNSDVETPEGWLKTLIERLESDQTIAAVSPKILSYNHKDSFEYAGAAGGFIDFLGYPFCRGRVLKSIERDSGQYDRPRDVFWSSGACMLIRADVFRELGGFDADFFAHMEEIDLCWRAHLSGYRVMVEPTSKVYHLGGGTLPNNSPRKLYLNYRNNLSMLYKNLSPRSMRVVLLSRMILDLMSAFVFLLQGRADLFWVVIKAHKDFEFSRKSMREKRRNIQKTRKRLSRGVVYRGSIVFRYMMGLRKFSDIQKFREKQRT